MFPCCLSIRKEWLKKYCKFRKIEAFIYIWIRLHHVTYHCHGETIASFSNTIMRYFGNRTYRPFASILLYPECTDEVLHWLLDNLSQYLWPLELPSFAAEVFSTFMPSYLCSSFKVSSLMAFIRRQTVTKSWLFTFHVSQFPSE